MLSRWETISVSNTSLTPLLVAFIGTPEGLAALTKHGWLGEMLDHWHKQARPCLLSRTPAVDDVTPSRALTAIHSPV